MRIYTDILYVCVCVAAAVPCCAVMHLPLAALAQRGRGPSAGLSHQESCEGQTCQEAREEAGEKGVLYPMISSAASPHTPPETETLLQKSVSAPKEEARPRHHKAKQRHRERVRHSERESGAKDVGGALRQCLGPGCVQPARVNSKYCSEDCGMKLAAK